MLTENLVEDIIDNFMKNHKPVHGKEYFDALHDLLDLKDEVRTIEESDKIIKNEKDNMLNGNCAKWVTCDYKKLEHGFIETYPGKGIYCSNCRIGLEIGNKWYKFCPNCGKKMKEDR